MIISSVLMVQYFLLLPSLHRVSKHSTMQRIIILLATCLLLNRFQNLDAKLNVIPRDTEVMVNYSTYMNCSTSLEAEKVHWRHGNNYVSAGARILEPYNVRFSVEINSSIGTNNLVIRSIQPSDAGHYECLEDEGFGEQSSAQLIVLDDDPVCKSNMHSTGVIGPNDCDIEPVEIILSCSIIYHGNVYPILQWNASGGYQSIAEGLCNITSNKNEVIYTLTMNSTLDLNNSSFICQTTRTSKRSYSCSSDVIKILYAIGNKVTINMTMNDEVTCFANTSQICSYKWKWYRDHDWIIVSNGQILKPNKVGLHRCEATCSLNNKSCTVESMFAEVSSTSATSERNLMSLMVLIVLPVIALIGAVIYFRKKIQNQDISLMELKRKIAKQEEPLERVNESKREEREQEQQILIDGRRYCLDPILVQTIRTKAAEERRKEITGLTILDKEMFVASRESSEVEVYDSMKFSFSRRWNLNDSIYPKDIKSCDINKCLYICSSKNQDQSREILRVDPNGNLINNWSIGEDYGRLSVTHDSNVILTVPKRNVLSEYSPDGQLIREINLSLNAGIIKPWHAIKLSYDQIVVSHGWSIHGLHRICVVNADGKIEKSFGGKRGSSIGQMNRPLYLAVLDSGFVMVADSGNGRILLLDSDLEFKREILSKENPGLRVPSRILLDQANSRLFVVDNYMDKNLLTNGRILVFDFR